MPGWKLLPFTMQSQTQRNWCWAAVTASVAAFFDTRTRSTQCAVANTELQRRDCCRGGAGGPCNVYGYLASALHRIGHLKAWSAGRPATLDRVQDEIDRERPLCLRVAWRSGGAHFLTIVGYLPESEALAGSRLIAVDDSQWGPSDVPYNVLCAAYRQDGRWTDTYFTKKARRRDRRRA
jgi:hypothetical protein